MRSAVAVFALALFASATFAQAPPSSFDDGKATPFVSVPRSVNSTGDVVKDLAQSRHGTSFRKNFIISAKDGGMLEYGCFLQCHSSVKILQDKDAKPADFVKGAKYEQQRSGLTCPVCHELTPESPGIKTRNAGWEKCTVCHFAEHRNTGKLLHHASKEMFFGYKVGDVELKASEHSTVPGMDCTSCHKVSATNHTFMPERNYVKMFDQQLCRECHANAKEEAADLVKKQAVFKKRIDELYTKEFKPIFNAAMVLESMKDGKPADVEAFKRDFASVIAPFSMVQRERASGLHNFANAKRLLDFSEPIIHEMTRKYPEIIKTHGTGDRDY
jgi:predicted CXXCH cytochrome family protein